MELMVAPKPIFDKYKEVRGYYLAYQVGNALIEGGKPHLLDNQTDSPFFDFVNETGLAALTGNKLIFVPVTDVLLATDLENVCRVEHSQVVLMLNRRASLSGANLQRVARFKEMGFKIAFKRHSDIAALEPFYPHTDFIFCGNDTDEIMPLVASINRSRETVKVIANYVDSNQIFDRLALFNMEFFSGRFYMKAVLYKDNRVSPLKINYLQVLNQVSQEDFDLDKFADVVQRDTALAVQFLKMVNSSAIRSNEITSLRHAAALLGQKEIKKWATTAVTTFLGQEGPGEVTRLSMLRAKFCENLAELFEMAIHRENLFLMGLFSVLDVILETSIEKALQLVHIPDKVRTALISGDNDFGMVYQFVKSYEQGDWTEISRIALTNKLPIGDIAAAYSDALIWYGRMITMKDPA